VIKKQTLFDFKFYAGEGAALNKTMHHYPYPLMLKSLKVNSNSKQPNESEVDIFNDVVTLEENIYLGSRTVISGPVKIRSEKSRIDLENLNDLYRLPTWVENDSFEFAQCKAKAAVVIDHFPTAEKLVRSKEWKNLKFIVLCGFGLPTAPTRRVLHRIEAELNIPLYYLGSNNVWSYFSYSIFKRGALSPNHKCSFLATKSLRYIGLRASSQNLNCARHATEKKSRLWKERLAALRMYECFKDSKWKSEFDMYKTKKYDVNLFNLIAAIGVDKFLSLFVNKNTLSESL
jgi:DNA topoisomerase VI subunit A